MPLICPHCKIENPDNSHFCAQCGKAIGLSPSEYVVVKRSDNDAYQTLYEQLNTNDDTEVLSPLMILFLKRWNSLNKRALSKSGVSIEFWAFCIFWSLVLSASFIWLLIDLSVFSIVSAVLSIGIPVLTLYLLNKLLS